MIALRNYQQAALDDLRHGFRSGHRRQLLTLPTGAGKTVIASAIARGARDKGRVTLFVTDRIALADQAINAMAAAGLRSSVVRGSESQIVGSHDVIVGSIQSLARRAAPDVGLIVIDEAHILHRAHLALIKQFPATPVIGLTATPFAAGLGRVFSRLVRGPSVESLTASGHLVPAIAFGPSQPDLHGLKVRRGDYVASELAQRLNIAQHLAHIVATWKRLGESRQTLAFAVDIEHSKAIAGAFIAADVRAAHLDGRAPAPERRELIERFKSGDIAVLTSVACLGIGFDAPGASCILLARPTKSAMLHFQQIGRGLRPAPGKADCLLIDLAGNVVAHGLPADCDVGPLDTATKTWAPQSRNACGLVACPACKRIKPRRSGPCPGCGADPIASHRAGGRSADIVKIDARSLSERRRFYRELVGAVESMGKRRAWAAHLYCAHVHEYPPRAWRKLEPLEPSRETLTLARDAQARFVARLRRSA